MASFSLWSVYIDLSERKTTRMKSERKRISTRIKSLSSSSPSPSFFRYFFLLVFCIHDRSRSLMMPFFLFFTLSFMCRKSSSFSTSKRTQLFCSIHCVQKKKTKMFFCNIYHKTPAILIKFGTQFPE